MVVVLGIVVVDAVVVEETDVVEEELDVLVCFMLAVSVASDCIFKGNVVEADATLLVDDTVSGYCSFERRYNAETPAINTISTINSSSVITKVFEKTPYALSPPTPISLRPIFL